MGKFTSCPLPFLCWFFFVYGASLFPSSSAADSIDRVGSLREGETLVSAGGRFELGFFSPGSSTKKYLCVRFNKGQEKPIVWVANRERPLDNSAGVLKFRGDGNLVVLDKAGDIVWSTVVASNISRNTIAQLLDSGNLIIIDTGNDSPSGLLWQSFDKPGDTLLPGMKFLVNTKTGASRHITSWKSADDPFPGNYSYSLEVDKLPRLVLREGPTLKFTTGPWNGIRFSCALSMNANDVYNSSVVISGDETYYTDSMIQNLSFLRVLLLPSGFIERHVWNQEARTWTRLWTVPEDCERFAICGPYGTCAADFLPSCQCLKGFRPKSPREWSVGKGTDGCVRNTRLGCASSNFFLKVLRVKLPEMNNSTVNRDMSLEECHQKCVKDCSCTAYASADVKQERGCITWSGDLVDIRNLTANVQEFYLRVAASDMDPVTSDFRKKRSKQPVIVASMSAISGMVLLVLCAFWMKKMMNKTKTGTRKHHPNEMVAGEDMEVELFDFETIISATNNFSIDNKIGEGGFGTVHKGVLEGGQEVAVKRLSLTSIQGVGEFMNEVKLIGKLQHKNLVRLLGCCIQGDERMLIFEYMQNKSLDLFIVDEAKRSLLGWRMRLDIILGIARGLVYLHHDSRLKIIHRDLKAGNILLDGAMNPKISDFGTARIFSADQHIENTIRVIGTYGYMSPEYAIDGIISIKCDVFSFGVLVLEVLSGIKSRGIYGIAPQLNLLSHAWKLWQEGNCLELLDMMVTSSNHEMELRRCIHIGLLCVQENASDRPTMRAVVMMLDSENFPLPQPRKPGFLVFRSTHSPETSSSSKHEPSTTNEMTITSILEGR